MVCIYIYFDFNVDFFWSEKEKDIEYLLWFIDFVKINKIWNKVYDYFNFVVNWKLNCYCYYIMVYVKLGWIK